MTPHPSEKQVLRNRLKALRLALSPAAVARYGELMAEKAWQVLEKKGGQTVHIYLPIQNEVDTLPLIGRLLARGIRVVVPRTLAGRQLEHLELDSLDTLETGRYGTRSPKQGNVFAGQPDTVFVPALGFGQDNSRLGYGAGYYDSFLASCPALKVGLAYPFQILPGIPSEPHDVKMDMVLSVEGFDAQ